jgi:hypothetical protein
MMNNKFDDPSPVAFSISLYDTLLAAYPTGFRHEYGPHMAQVFRDYCLRSYRQDGLPGMLNLWTLILLDYIKSVVEEHLQKGIHMSKSTFTRLSGWSFVLGAITFMVAWLISIRDVPEYNRYSALSRPIDLYLEYAIAILLPVTFLLLLIGMIGLYLRYGGETNSFGKFGLIVGIIGGVVSLGGGITMFTTEIEWSWIAWMVGTFLYFLGLVPFGIFALRENLLPRWNALPIFAGIWLPLWLLIVSQMDWGWESSEFISLGVFLATMVSLAALGLTLKSDAHEEVVIA